MSINDAKFRQQPISKNYAFCRDESKNVLDLISRAGFILSRYHAYQVTNGMAYEDFDEITVLEESCDLLEKAKDLMYQLVDCQNVINCTP